MMQVIGNGYIIIDGILLRVVDFAFVFASKLFPKLKAIKKIVGD